MSAAALFAAACEKNSASGSAEPTTTKAMEGAPSPKQGTVPCLGIHECKGKSACHVVGSHACAGQNACKGKGWIEVPQSECDAKGGKVVDS